jgi:hypothetical protein
MQNGGARRKIHEKIVLCRILSVLLAFILIVLSPVQGHAVGDSHLYAMPGAWAQDLEPGWIGQLHLRYVSFDDVFDDNGDSRDAGMDMSALQTFAKLIHVTRLSEEYQLTNVAIAVLAAHLEAEMNNGATMSTSGQGDVISSNYIGRWWNNRMVHAAVGFSLKFPLGDYDRDEALNIGENRYVLYLPFLLFQYRYPLGKGMFFVDSSMDLEWRGENPDTDFDDHDVAEFNVILTYFTSKDCKLGFFFQPDYQMATNESKLRDVDLNDGDFYTFGTGLGVVWNMKPGHNVNLKWTREWYGRELNNGAYVPKIDDIHFMWTYSF